MKRGSSLERLDRGGLVTQQKLGLRLGRRCVVRTAVGAADRVQSGACQLARRLRLTGDEAQRRRVDRRVVATGAGVDRPVEVTRAYRLCASPGRRGFEREVLGDARAERGDVLLVGRGQAVALEAPRRLSRRSGARQREHGTVLQPEIVGVLGETLLSEIDCGQQLASPLCAPDGLEPVGVRPAHATSAFARRSTRRCASFSIGRVYASAARSSAPARGSSGRGRVQPNWWCQKS